ncbi:GNAT family N-acetyltransferase [Halobacteriales archaeon QS_9_68_42]|nr:MAG: GNAT family N-acetyltransferase [Halobacteriales archaeon QS_9_68_42]
MEARRVETDDELADALAVRRAVFVEEQGVPEHLEVDGNDDSATHFVAYDGDRSVGAARFRPYDDSTAKVERVAVLKPERGAGIGRRLMDAVETAAADDGYESVVLHAQVPVVGFYERLDYEVTSEEFENAGIPHREMWKGL